MDANNQADWKKIIDSSVYLTVDVCGMAGVNQSQMSGYLSLRSTPRKEIYDRITKVMTHVVTKPRTAKHPSFGYATLEQMEVLKRGGAFSR